MRFALLLLFIVLVASGCAKKAETTTAPESSAATTESATPASEASAPAPASSPASAAGNAPAGTTVAVTMVPVNGSNESGSASINDVANEAGIHTSTIQLTLSNAPAGVNQPVNIAKGTCPNAGPGASIFMEPAVNGKMTHELGGIGLVDLRGQAIVVMSTDDLVKAKLISCGQIPLK